jgi:hypothetical protein
VIEADGTLIDELSPFSPTGVVAASPLVDTLYRVEVTCSSDRACTASRDVQVMVYSGDGGDLGSDVDAGSPVGLGEGLFVDHDAALNETVLTWRARPQPPGVNGFDLFKGTIAQVGIDIFVLDRFFGGVFDPDGGAGPLTSSCNQPNGNVGDELTLVVATAPPVGSADLYMIGHSSANALAIAPLGKRPSASNRGGTLVSASVICP